MIAAAAAAIAFRKRRGSRRADLRSPERKACGSNLNWNQCQCLEMSEDRGKKHPNLHETIREIRNGSIRNTTLGLGRLVLVGDTMQLKAVSAGQPFRLLQKAGMATARMDDILRQRSADLKGAVAHMVAGDPELAMASLGGDVRELPPDALGETAARLWLGLPEAARTETAILAPTHALREEINAVIREGLADEGVLRGTSLEIMRLVDRRLTRCRFLN